MTTPKMQATPHFRDLLTLPSRVAYLGWRTLRLQRRLAVHLKAGEEILLRPIPAEDYGAAREVFVDLNYEDPRDTGHPVRRIVDCGANIGCSCLYWARAYPGCQVEAFEPHPVHLELLRENLRRNHLEDQVRVHAVAVGVRAGQAFLSEQGLSSRVADAPQAAGHHRIDVVDFFEMVGPEPIDLLKLDVEGSEYALLADARFLSLRATTVVLEWHPTPAYPAESGRAWCQARLEQAGYTVGEHKTLLWGWR